MLEKILKLLLVVQSQSTVFRSPPLKRLNKVYICVCAHECRCPQRPERAVRYLGVGVTSGCESPDMGAWEPNSDPPLRAPIHLYPLGFLFFKSLLKIFCSLRNNWNTGFPTKLLIPDSMFVFLLLPCIRQVFE